MDKIKRMKELIQITSKASKAYYAENKEIMSNYEYDKLYDELIALEEETGMVLAGSPTITVGYEAVDELPKEAHESPMLSLGKTKDREELRDWLKDKEGLLSWKLDGLTIVLTYQNGELLKAVTRGNGEIGEVITNNAKVFKNIPLRIQYPGELILRGEAVITYSDFENINSQITDVEARYKNPRNLCSGSVRQLNNEITADRNVRFYAFSLVKAEDVDFENSREKQFLFLKQQGFDVVDYVRVDASNILETIEDFEKAIETYNIPSDGLVLAYDDIKYGESLGRTSKFPRHSIAFKWADETAETTITDIEWSASRTGLINPVAIFEPVELEGTTVSRASVHNVSILKQMNISIGAKVNVYKANMIIPQIAEVVDSTNAKDLNIPSNCPVCGGVTTLKENNGVETLHCENPECIVKHIKKFTKFCERDGANIVGMSEATMEFLVNKGWVHSLLDIYNLDRYKKEWAKESGFGVKSVKKLLDSIEESKSITLENFLNAQSIDLIGYATCKDLAKFCNGNIETFCETITSQNKMAFLSIDGFGQTMYDSLINWYNLHWEEFMELKEMFTFKTKGSQNDNNIDLSGKTFVITGSIENFGGRNALKQLLESMGAKVSGSVSSKTTALINNDISSNSSKNKKAKELNIPIWDENELITNLGL